MRWVRPLVAPISQPFGNDYGEGPHPGTDYSNGRYGDPIFAGSDGVVIYAGPASGFGDNAIAIYHPADDVSTTYGHSQARYVETGQNVTAGQHIADVGSEGHSTGPHLHLEIRHGNAPWGGYARNFDVEPWLVVHTAALEDPVATFPTVDVNKALNMQDPIVRTLQGLLEARGGMIKPANVSHPVLTTVVTWFQQQANVPVDRVVGPTTWAALVKPLNGK